MMQIESGFARIGMAKLFYQVAGEGQPFVMIHAGVADHRQWNNEFARFATRFRVIRYDRRGYGRSEPVEGEFSHLGDLTALLDLLNVDEPVVLMGCSMGGGLAMDFALTHPSRVRALMMIDAGPENAYKIGDLDLVAEIETQIWFDGAGRTPRQINQEMRRLAYEMDRAALAHEVKKLGRRLPDTQSPAASRLAELELPVLVIVGAHDTPYFLAAADYMVEKLPLARKVIIEAAAHLPNMDQPNEFQRIVETFLGALAG